MTTYDDITQPPAEMLEDNGKWQLWSIPPERLRPYASFTDDGRRKSKRAADDKLQALITADGGIKEPIRLTFSWGEKPYISDGRHRTRVAIRMGLPFIVAKVVI